MKNAIRYEINKPLETVDIISVFRGSGITRPVDDPARIRAMFDNSNLIVSAWAGDQLVGVSRALTDFAYACYLSDLAILKEYQKLGIGKKMLEMTKEQIGDKAMLLLLSAPAAMDYYPKMGFEKVQNGFILKRKG